MSRTAPKKKTAKAAPKSSGLRRFALGLLLLAMALCTALVFTERRNWPAGMRNEDAVIALYQTRDQIIDRLWSRPAPAMPQPPQKEGKAPMNVLPKAQKPEQGYSPQDRAKLDALIEKEGDLP